MNRGHRLGRSRVRLLVAMAVIAATNLATVGPALADTLTPPPAEIPPTDTDFTLTVGVPQFDPALGTLISRTVTLSATVTGSMGVENTSTTSGSTGDMELSAQVTVSRALDPTDTVTVASPAVTETFDLTVFDGTADFGGTSGATFADIDDMQTVTETRTDPDILAAATGTGTLEYIVEAIGTSSANATGGNTSTFFASQAAASISVTYEYQPNVPAIDIEKSTNGQDADTQAEAVPLTEGAAITWEYVVTNTGSVDLTNVTVVDDQGVSVTCPQDTLAVGEVMTCSATGVAELGPYTNIGTVTGTAPDDTTVTDSDPSNYNVPQQTGGNPAIQIIKDPPTQTLVLTETDTATWTITVTNTGDEPLTNVTVTDAMAPGCNATIGDLAVGETSAPYTCSLSGVEVGFTNVAVVTGDDPNGIVVTDDDSAIVEVELPPTGANSSRDLVIFGIVLLGLGAFLVAPQTRRRRN